MWGQILEVCPTVYIHFAPTLKTALPSEHWSVRPHPHINLLCQAWARKCSEFWIRWAQNCGSWERYIPALWAPGRIESHHQEQGHIKPTLQPNGCGLSRWFAVEVWPGTPAADDSGDCGAAATCGTSSAAHHWGVEVGTPLNQYYHSTLLQLYLMVMCIVWNVQVIL